MFLSLRISYLSFYVKLITLFVTTLWANSVDDKLMIVVLLFSENRLSSFIQIVSISHESLHSGNNKKYFKLSSVVNVTSILHKSTAGRYRPVSYPDGPITARCRFIKNAIAGNIVKADRLVTRQLQIKHFAFSSLSIKNI